MYQSDHPEFRLPKGDPDSLTIWRFMNINRFEDLVTSNTLYFPSLASMADEHEGVFPENFAKGWIEYLRTNNRDDEAEGAQNIIKNALILKPETFVSCWSIGQAESYALWRLYTKDKKAVGIKSTVQRLINALYADDGTQYIGEVNYYDGINYSFRGNSFGPVMYKWNYYKFESELRLVCHHNLCGKSMPPGIRAKIYVDDLIDKVYLHPHSEQTERDTVRQLLDTNNLQNKDIIKSGIREKWA